MIFWDTSALIPLLVPEGETTRARSWVAADPAMAVWWGTPVECSSALERRFREGGLDRPTLAKTHERLAQMHAAWIEIVPSEAARGHAIRLLRRHPLRAADALQLGAALVWARDRPAGHRFATFDLRLGEAALGEGFLSP